MELVLSLVPKDTVELITVTYHYVGGSASVRFRVFSHKCVYCKDEHTSSRRIMVSGGRFVREARRGLLN